MLRGAGAIGASGLAGVALSSNAAASSAGIENGDRVATTADLVIHTRPSLYSADVWTAPNGSAGYVRDGPVEGYQYTWWKVGFNAGYEGWCVAEYLETAPVDGGEGGGSGGRFGNDQRVATTTDLVIHTRPDLSAPDEWVAPNGSAGYVRDGPTSADDYTWWEVEFNAGYRGWCVEKYLTEAPVDGGDGGNDDNPNVVEGFPYFYQYDNAIDPGGTCGNTSIAMLLNYYGWDGTPDDVSRWYTDAQSTRPPGAAEAFNGIASEVGIDQRVDDGYQWSISELRETVRSGTPVIVWGMFTGVGHVMPVLGYEDGQYVCNDPAGEWNGRTYDRGDHYGRDGDYIRYDAGNFEAAIDYSQYTVEVVYPE